MAKRELMVLVVAASLIGCGQVAAQIGGGSQGFKVTKEKKDAKKKTEEKKIKKWPLPPAAKVPELDLSKFEKEMKKFNEAQLKAVEEVKQKIETRRADLAKKQDAARAAYERAADKKGMMEAVKEINITSNACRQYNPNQDFDTELKRIAAAKNEMPKKGKDDLKGFLE